MTDGGTRVHRGIIESFGDRDHWVFFSTKLEPEPLRMGIVRHRGEYCLSLFAAHRVTYWLCVGVLSNLINRHEHPTLFGNSFLYYSLIPYLKRTATKVDLLHSFDGECERKALPVVDQLDARVVIDANTLKNIENQYRSLARSNRLARRVVLIENATDVPDLYPQKEANQRLKIIYVGRTSEEKRVHLVARIGALCHRRDIPADFVLVGPREQDIKGPYLPHCEPLGIIADSDRLASIYQASDIILVTSRYEGFPLSLMEGMAYGVVPVSTDVGGIRRHVIPHETGFLIPNGDEDEIVASAADIIGTLSRNRALLKQLSQAAYTRARTHFTKERFSRQYRKLLLSFEEQFSKENGGGVATKGL